MSARANSKHKLYDSLFDGMHQYMYSAENLLRLGNHSPGGDIQKSSNRHVKNTKKVIHKTESTTFEPRQHDTLFWCFYIAKHGFHEYELIKTTPFQTEKRFKISSVDMVRQNSDALKAIKLKVSDVENELVNESKITLTGLRALGLVHGISIFYVSGLTYSEFNHGGEMESSYAIIICDKTKNRMSIRYHDSSASEYMKKVRANYFHISNPAKPMNAISGYTLSELQDICEKLSLPIVRSDGKKETKKFLYEAILNAL